MLLNVAGMQWSKEKKKKKRQRESEREREKKGVKIEKATIWKLTVERPTQNFL